MPYFYSSRHPPLPFNAIRRKRVRWVKHGGSIDLLMSATWEMLYSHTKPERVEYTRSIVSYLDILGFRELVDSRSAGEISRILPILAESVRPDSLFKSEKIEFTRF